MPSSTSSTPLVAALGMSLAFIPSLGTAISSAPPEEGGLAAGIVNTSYQVGSALGLAAMTAIAASHGADHLGNAHALTDGFSVAFIGAGIVAALGAVLAAALLRTHRTEQHSDKGAGRAGAVDEAETVR